MTLARGTELVLDWMADEIPDPRVVEGTYVTRYIPELDYTQHIIDGIVVDPATVELLDAERT